MPNVRQQSSLLGSEELDSEVAFNNNLYLAKVIDTFPERNLIDVLLMNGGVLRDVQVTAPSASSRSGIVDLPKVSYHPEDAEFVADTSVNPISGSGGTGTTGKRPRIITSDKEVADGYNAYAIVGYIEGVIQMPVCLGFLYPETSEMMFFETQFLNRHESDIYELIDESGNYDHVFPDGTFIRIGDGTTRTDLVKKDTNQSWTTKADDPATQETPKTVHVEHTTGTTITINPDGSVDMNVVGDQTINVTGAKTETVGTVTENANDILTVNGDKTETITGAKTETVGTVTENSDDTLTVNGNKTETITGNSTENITGNKSFDVDLMNIDAVTTQLMTTSLAMEMTLGEVTAESLVMNIVSFQVTGDVANINSSNVNLGISPAFGVILGEIFVAQFAAHVHSGGGTGTPTVPLVGVTSTTVKASL